MFATGNSTIVHNKTFFFGKTLKLGGLNLYTLHKHHLTRLNSVYKNSERDRERKPLSLERRREREVGASPS